MMMMVMVFTRVKLLGMSSGIEEVGNIQWQVALCLLLSWTLTFLALSKGVKSVGKVTVAMVTFPSLAMVVLIY